MNGPWNISKIVPDPYKHAEFDLEAAYSLITLNQFEKAQESIDLAKKYASDLKSKTLDTHIKFAQARLNWFTSKNKKAIKNANDAVKSFRDMDAEGYAEIYSNEISNWEKGTQNTTSSTMQGTSPESRELYQLLEINHKISSMLDSQSLLKEVLSGAMRITGAQHGYLFLLSDIKKTSTITRFESKKDFKQKLQL